MRQIFGIVGGCIVKSDILSGNGILFCMEGGEKNSVFQFPDVAGPRMQLQYLYRRSVKMLFRSLLLLSVSLEQIICIIRILEAENAESAENAGLQSYLAINSMTYFLKVNPGETPDKILESTLRHRIVGGDFHTLLSCELIG